MSLVGGLIEDVKGDKVNKVNLVVQREEEMMAQMVTNSTGTYTFELPKGPAYEIIPEKDTNPLNGVSTFDLVLISKQILGIQPFEHAHQWVAADINQSATITTYDLVLLRRLILNIDTRFTHNTSWRFVPMDYEFSMEQSVIDVFPESIKIENLADAKTDMDFRAIKIGDINGSVISNDFIQAEDRSFKNKFTISIADQWLKKGTTFNGSFLTSQLHLLDGFQLGLSYDGLIVNNFKPEIVTAENINLDLPSSNIIPISWAKLDNDNQKIPTKEQQLFTLNFTVLEDGFLSEKLALTDRLIPREAFTETGEFLQIELAFKSNQADLQLFQNRPNPFKQKTIIGLDMPEAEYAEFVIRSETGVVVKSMKKDFKKGYNEIELLIDDLTPGIYFYQINSKYGVEIKKMIMLY